MKALILEGGAMRSVHSAGALTALSEMGFSYDHFDMFFGASAGASTAAYFLADQSYHFWTMWTESMLSKDFINLKNLLSLNTKPVINLDFIAQEILLKRHEIDIKKLIASKTKFYVTATNCNTGEAEYFLNDKEETFCDILKASSSIPVLYNKSVKLNGVEYMDGAIADAIPIKKAIDAGATEIYVLLTRHPGYRKKSSFANTIVSNMYKDRPLVKTALLNRHNVYNESLEFIESFKNNISGVNIHIIRPRYNLGVSRTTTDPKKIKSAFLVGYHDAISVLKTNNLLKINDKSATYQKI